MKPKDKDEILHLLNDIKNKSTLAVKGGSGGANRYSMREPNLIWELGLALQTALENSGISKEKRKESIRRFSRKYDKEILGEGNEWSITAYDWITHFITKEHFLFVCKLAGFRDEASKNRFNKRRLRYLRPLYTKFEEPTLPKNKISKLTKLLQDDNTLELSDPDYLCIITKVRGKDRIELNSIMDSINDLSNIVEGAIEDSKNTKARAELKENLGEILIKQLRFALQLCVMEKKSDFEFAQNKVKDVFKKKPKTKSTQFQELFDNLKILLKNFEEKKKRIKKANYYELEQLNSKLDAVRDEKIYEEFMRRKESIAGVFG